MRIEEWMTREVLACRPETNLDEAARLMWENDCGCLPVVDVEDRLVGLVTDRDVLMGAYTQGQGLSDLTVSTCMKRGVLAALPADGIEDVIRMMGDHQVRRIPVVDERGRLVGLASMNDLVRHVTGVDEAKTRASLSARLLEAMACICEPRRFACEMPVATATPPKTERTVTSAKAAAV